MIKITAFIYFIALCAILQAFPLEDDKTNSTYDDTHHIMDLTPGHRKESSSTTNNSNDTNVGDSSAIPAVYVTPFPKRVARNASHKKESDSEESSTPLFVGEGINGLVDAILLQSQKIANETHDSTESNSAEKNRKVRDTKDQDVKVPAVHQNPHTTAKSVTPSQSGSSSTTRYSTPTNKQKSNFDQKFKREVRDTDKQSSQVKNTEGKVVQVPATYGNHQSSTQKSSIQSSTHSSSTPNSQYYSRKVRDADNSVSVGPGIYKTEQNRHSSDSTSNCLSSITSSSTPSYQDKSRKVRDTGSNVTKVPGTYENQQSSTSKSASPSSTATVAGKAHIFKRDTKTQHTTDGTTEETTDNNKSSGSDQTIPRVGRSLPDEEKQNKDSGNTHNDEDVSNIQNTAKETKGATDDKQSSENPSRDQKITRFGRSLPDEENQSKTKTENTENKTVETTDNKKSSLNPSQDQTIPRFGRSLPDEEDQNKENNENKHKDEDSSVKNPVILENSSQDQTVGSEKPVN